MSTVSTFSESVSNYAGQIDMTFNPDRPFNDLPNLPPVSEIETKEILRRCISARTALAKLQACGNLIPNLPVLINTIPLLESQASSEIENIVTTTDKLFRYASDVAGRADPATKGALRYRAALYHGFELVKNRPVSANLAVEVCRMVNGQDLNVRKTPGTRLINDATGQAIYTPPEGEEILRSKLANWELFIHEAEEIDPLIRMAIMHYQFVAIHPFIDGNGRTGRILNLLYLVEKGLLDFPVLNHSRFILQNKELYHRLLLEVTTKKAWERWILFILSIVRYTAEWTMGKIISIRGMLDHTIYVIRETTIPKIYTRELAELIYMNPYCRISDVVDANIVKRQTAAQYLKSLVASGLLEEVREGRENLYINTRFMSLLAERDLTRKAE